MQQAIDLKEKKPDLNVYILYRDIRTYGRREDLYTRARELGVLFIRYNADEKPVVEKVTAGGKEKLRIRVRDHVLGKTRRDFSRLPQFGHRHSPKGTR